MSKIAAFDTTDFVDDSGNQYGSQPETKARLLTDLSTRATSVGSAFESPDTAKEDGRATTAVARKAVAKVTATEAFNRTGDFLPLTLTAYQRSVLIAVILMPGQGTTADRESTIWTINPFAVMLAHSGDASTRVAQTTSTDTPCPRRRGQVVRCRVVGRCRP